MIHTEPKIVIGVPGKWKNRSEIVMAIAEKSGGYLFAGQVLMDIKTKTSFEVDIYQHDPSLAKKVRSSSMGQIPEQELQALDDHTFTVYVLSNDAGREVVSKLADAVVGLLNSGGIVAKIEKAGFSVSAETWRKHASVKAAYSLYRSMVTLVGSGTEHFTCGMSAFALPDCSVHGVALEAAFETSTEFCCYLMDETPQLADGHTFSASKNAPKFRMSFDAYTYYERNHMFHNPNGIWKLALVEEP